MEGMAEYIQINNSLDNWRVIVVYVTNLDETSCKIL